MTGVAYLADATLSLLSTFRLIDTIFQRSGSLQVAPISTCKDLHIMLKAESKQRKPGNLRDLPVLAEVYAPGNPHLRKG